MDVKQLLSVYVRSNEDANQALFEVLGDAPDGFLARPGGYFGSILGTLNHILVSELGVMNRFRGTQAATPVLDTPVLTFTRPQKGELLVADFGALRSHRWEVDSVLRRYIDEVPNDVLISEVPATESDSARRPWTPAYLLLHLMNHATHHRGQISQVLDEEGIAHDFSGIMQAMRRW